MGKSSSSSKKTKHSTDSSKLLSVKKKKKKKKTKRSKSKKIRRLKDYSDSDSSLYSTSEDDYRRKKRRSKKSKKRYSSSESDDSEDDYRVLRKKKKSKRKEELVGKKKSKKKGGSRKRRKRDSSSSSSTSSESDGKSRRLGKGKALRRRSEDESEEGREADECWQVEDEVVSEKNSRRLKSIVVVSYSYDNGGRKEDTVNDYDADESDEKKHLDDVRYHEASRGSYPKTVAYDESEEDTKSESSKSPHREDEVKADELEAILKKRALENLKRFRGEMQKTGVASKEVSSASDSERVLLTVSEKPQESLDHGLREPTVCNSSGSKDLEASQRNLQGVNVEELETVLPGDTAKVKVGSGISSCTTKRKLVRPVLGQESLNLASRKEVTTCQDAEAESVNGSSSLAENIETAKASSTLDTKSLSQSEEKTMDDEPKDESQYEQKTMTVMRGGEMVQVSYKVYIPKKRSSLGRRQLKR